MKYILIFLLALLCSVGYAQFPVNQYMGSQTTLVTSRGGLKADSSLILPQFPDTIAANRSPYIKFYPGNMIRVFNDIYVRNTTATKWMLINPLDSISNNAIDSITKINDTVYARKYGVFVPQYPDPDAKFQNNIVMNADANNRLGYWVNGDTIPVAGLGLDSAFKVITQKAVPPTYLPPLVSISSVPTSGSYEIGTNLGTITFSRVFTQRDGGIETSITYKKNGINLSGNTDTVSSLTSASSYTVTSTYDTGACKLNNLGVIDCTGRIVAGSVTSSSITFTPLPRFYWGYVNSYGAPSNSEILATTGGSSLLTTTKSRTYNVTVAGSNRYIYLAYPTNLGTLSSILMSGFETIDAFTPPFTVNVTNAQGYTQSYYVYMNENPFNAGSTPFVVP